MTYTYTITEELSCIIRKNNTDIDVSGPWESEESASAWAQAYVEELNIINFEEDSNASN